jgi:hypothetical protein
MLLSAGATPEGLTQMMRGSFTAATSSSLARGTVCGECVTTAFPNEAGRQAHLSGRVAAALMAKAADLSSRPPAIEKVDVLAAKLL